MSKVKNYLFTLLIIYGYSSLAQIKEFNVKEVEKEVVKINDTLYAFRCETTNFEYNSFLNAIAKKDSSLYRIYIPDSSRWLETGNNALAMYYHRHIGFNDYPVLCISYEGAIAYCNWLTKLYNNDSKRKFPKVIFLLPSEQEWELAATGNIKNTIYPWGTNSLRDTRKGKWQGQFLANFRRLGDGSIVSDENGNPVFKRDENVWQISSFNDMAFYTAHVRSFFPNSIGIYNISGNAAEMTIEKGLTKGGSWNSLGGEISISYRLYFYEPSIEVGFRIFMKIIEE